MSTDPHDIPGLRAAGEAYARFAPSEQPPAALDHAIRRAAAAHARRSAGARARAWGVGLAAAATIVLGAVSVWRLDVSSTGDDGMGREISAGGPPMRAESPDTPGSAKPTLSAEGGANATDACVSVAGEPERWLGCIATLERAGEYTAATRELDAFRARYPDFALPAELAPTDAR